MSSGRPPSSARTYRPAQVRFYVDADMLGLAKVLAGLRNDLTYPGDPGGIVHRRQRPPCPVTSPAALDPEWIPQVAERGWLIVTRDSHIQDRRAEITGVREHGARMVCLAARDAGGTFQQLEVFMTQWRRIEAAAREPGPYIYNVTRTSFRAVSLQ